ncbi:hypothetical protein SDC9_66400 [bioreactor metagenome]|uniref:Uncharacterized protein n=1 Tax=bioreactor metagenome TaxID=1076179 RepID=A0A644Y0B0_9ZZZZ
MVVDDTEYDGLGDPMLFCREVVRECSSRGFDGVILDFEKPPSASLRNLVHTLAAVLKDNRWPLYLPESYAECTSHSKIIVSSALSGGSLRERLREMAEKYGTDRIVLGIERVAEDFFLPAPTGGGVPLSREALQARIAERSPAIFFSQELCAHYFTYMNRVDGAHFILFDDAATIQQKLSVAQGLEIRSAILAYPQVDDLLPQILENSD